VAIKCPKCHSENPDTLKFCGECGTQLIPPADAAAIVLVCLGFLLGGGGILFPQEEKKAPERETLVNLQTNQANYDASGRRDPFKNLLGGEKNSRKKRPSEEHLSSSSTTSTSTGSSSTRNGSRPSSAAPRFSVLFRSRR
jgi:hypothetical protein